MTLVNKSKLLSAVGTFRLPAVDTKALSQCFRDKLWTYRDPNFDHWFLTKNQPATPTEVITVVRTHKEWKFREAAESLPGVTPGLSDMLLGQHIIRLGYTLTVAQAEKAAAMTEAGESTHLRTDGWANFYFTETNDPNNPVAVGSVRRAVSRWLVGFHLFGHAHRWDAELRLLVRNLDPLKL